jgi:nucleotide-binding universal stress UspA family protein
MWTFPPRRILCPVDFGDASAAAVGVAGALAQRFEATLTVAHAESLDAPPYFTPEQIVALERERIAARRQGEIYLLKFARGATNAPLAGLVFDGAPSVMILKEAASHDLVVMGTHGRRGASRWWLGSVAERVVRESPVPVLVVRAGTMAPKLAIFERIVTIGEAGDSGTSYAEQLAGAFGGSTMAAPPVAATDAVRQARATLVVATMPAGAGDGTALERVATFVRSCERPVLFVPRQAAAAV